MDDSDFTVMLRGDKAQDQFNYDDLEAYPTLERWADRRYRPLDRWQAEFEAHRALAA
tara:strand:- start:828 stop:998 length:171 start_codon:yes stop_codon:yes gene_type:complete